MTGRTLTGLNFLKIDKKAKKEPRGLPWLFGGTCQTCRRFRRIHKKITTIIPGRLIYAYVIIIAH